MGHLHRSQKLLDGRARYSGTPLKYSFSEANHKKCALLVELDEAGEVRAEELAMTQSPDVRTLRGSFAEILEKPASEDYLAVELTDATPVLRAMEQLRERFPHVAKLSYTKQQETDLILPDAERTRRPDPVEMVTDLYRMQTGMEAEEKTVELLKQWIHDVEESMNG